MDKVKKIEQEVQALSPAELAQFRAWFLEYDGAAWDRQLERDAQAGRLDELAAEAVREHAAGKTKPLWPTTLVITFDIEVEEEEDGRWLAEVLELPGVLAYDERSEAAVSKVQALALRVVAERLDHGEAGLQ